MRKSKSLDTEILEGKRIMVVGTASPPINDTTKFVAPALGRELARFGCHLITGKMGEVDNLLVDSYTQTFLFESKHKPTLLKEKLTLIINDDDRSIQPEANVIVTSSQNIDYGRLLHDEVDALIIIGGRNAAKAITQKARQADVPILPFIATGGYAQDFFNSYSNIVFNSHLKFKADASSRKHPYSQTQAGVTELTDVASRFEIPIDILARYNGWPADKMLALNDKVRFPRSFKDWWDEEATLVSEVKSRAAARTYVRTALSVLAEVFRSDPQNSNAQPTAAIDEEQLAYGVRIGQESPASTLPATVALPPSAPKPSEIETNPSAGDGIELLTFDSGPDEPEKWVWVIGTVSVDLNDAQKWMAREIGKFLARSRIGLIVGGAPGVQSSVTQAYVEELPRGKSKAKFVRQYAFDEREPHFNLGESFTRLDTLEKQDEFAKIAAAVITIGGTHLLVDHIQSWATQNRKVFPISGSGGTSTELFAKMQDGFWPGLELPVPPEKFEWLDRPITNSTIAEELARTIVGWINGNLNYTPTFVRRRKLTADSTEPTSTEPTSAELSSVVHMLEEKLQTSPDIPVVLPSPSSNVSLIVVPVPGLDQPTSGVVRLQVHTNALTLGYKDQTYTGKNNLDAEFRPDVTQNPKEYGRGLFKGAIHGDKTQAKLSETSILRGFQNARRDLKDDLRVEIFVHPEDEGEQKWLGLGWEYLWGDGDDLPLSVNERSSVYRRLETARAYEVLEAKPLHLGFAICSPAVLGQPGDEKLSKLHPLDVEKEVVLIRESLRELEEKGVVKCTILGGEGNEPATLANIANLVGEGVHSMHIISHGLFLPNAEGKQEYRLVIETGRPRPVAGTDDIKAALVSSNLRLVTFASCESGNVTQVGVRDALAPKLVQQVPAVIAMQTQVDMSTARLLTQHFYNALARTGHVEKALAAARYAIYYKQKGADDNYFWGIPVLYLGSSSGELFKVKHPRKLSPFEPSPVEPQSCSTQGHPTQSFEPAQIETTTKTPARMLESIKPQARPQDK